MRVVERGQTTVGEAGENDTLSEHETVVWAHDDYPALRLLRVGAPGERPVWRLEGHADDAGTHATLEWDHEEREMARLYLAVYLRANSIGRPPEDPAHFVPVSVTLLPSRYLTAFLLAATTNDATWVSRRLDVERETVYQHISRVRSEWPDATDHDGEGDR